MSGRMVDKDGRRVEVILLDPCDGHGPQPWIRVSWRTVLLGRGYFQATDLADALALVDGESLVELIELPRRAGTRLEPNQNGSSSDSCRSTRR